MMLPRSRVPAAWNLCSASEWPVKILVPLPVVRTLTLFHRLRATLVTRSLTDTALTRQIYAIP